MPVGDIVRIGHLKTIEAFHRRVEALGLKLPCDSGHPHGARVTPGAPVSFRSGIHRQSVCHPSDGGDGTGSPMAILRISPVAGGAISDLAEQKLIWGGEAIAVRPEARANPNQLYAADHTRRGLAELLEILRATHRQHVGGTDDLVVGLQLTHSGRFCRPTHDRGMEPRILYRHPILDSRFGVDPNHPVMSDAEIRSVIDDYIKAARMAAELGYHFVDIKHCHGYLGHEFLSAVSRDGPYGGTLENRTRFLREIVQGIRAVAPDLRIGVRLSAFDFVPFRPDPERSDGRRKGARHSGEFSTTVCRTHTGLAPTRPIPLLRTSPNPVSFVDLLEHLDIRLVNLSAGSPYYNPHIQRPAYYPPSDGYQPPEDPPRRGRASGRRRSAHQGAESQPDCRGHGLFLSSGISATRRSATRTRQTGRLYRSGQDGPLLSAASPGRPQERKTEHPYPLSDVQRLHDRAKKRADIGLFSTGYIL